MTDKPKPGDPVRVTFDATWNTKDLVAYTDDGGRCFVRIPSFAEVSVLSPPEPELVQRWRAIKDEYKVFVIGKDYDEVNRNANQCIEDLIAAYSALLAERDQIR